MYLLHKIIKDLMGELFIILLFSILLQFMWNLSLGILSETTGYYFVNTMLQTSEDNNYYSVKIGELPLKK